MNVDRDVIRAKLRALADHVARIEQKRPASLAQLRADRDCQDILAHNLEKAVQLCIDIATHVCAAQGRAVETAGEAFTALDELRLIDATLATNLVRAVGFRNVSVHEYVAVD